MAKHFLIQAKYNGKCAHCKGAVGVGDQVYYYPDVKQVCHTGCATADPPPAKPKQERMYDSESAPHRPPR